MTSQYLSTQTFLYMPSMYRNYIGKLRLPNCTIQSEEFGGVQRGHGLIIPFDMSNLHSCLTSIRNRLIYTFESHRTRGSNDSRSTTRMSIISPVLHIYDIPGSHRNVEENCCWSGYGMEISYNESKILNSIKAIKPRPF